MSTTHFIVAHEEAAHIITGNIQVTEGECIEMACTCSKIKIYGLKNTNAYELFIISRLFQFIPLSVKFPILLPPSAPETKI